MFIDSLMVRLSMFNVEVVGGVEEEEEEEEEEAPLRVAFWDDGGFLCVAVFPRCTRVDSIVLGHLLVLEPVWFYSFYHVFFGCVGLPFIQTSNESTKCGVIWRYQRTIRDQLTQKCTAQHMMWQLYTKIQFKF